MIIDSQGQKRAWCRSWLRQPTCRSSSPAHWPHPPLDPKPGADEPRHGSVQFKQTCKMHAKGNGRWGGSDCTDELGGKGGLKELLVEVEGTLPDGRSELAPCPGGWVVVVVEGGDGVERDARTSGGSFLDSPGAKVPMALAPWVVQDRISFPLSYGDPLQRITALALLTLR